MPVRKKLAVACGVATLSASLPALAQTVPDCTTLPEYAKRIVGGGGSAATPTLAAVAKAVAAAAPESDEKFTIFYWQPSACTGYRAFKAGTSPATASTFRYWVKSGGVGVEKTCTGVSLPLDFSHMGSEVELCAGETKPDDIGDFPGPVQTVNVVTHKTSSEVSISAEALHFIFGYGQNGQVLPWTAGDGVTQRDNSSFVHNYIAAAIKLPDTAFWWDGTPGWVPAEHGDQPDPKAAFKDNHVTANQDTITFITKYVQNTGKPDETLGYISGSNADKARGDLKTLAYQGFGQDCGVFPDKDVNALDKINVRLGRYALWSPGHFYGKVDAKGKLVNDKVAQLFGWFSSTVVPPGGADATRAVIEAGDIPQCAMHANRDTALGAVYSYAPPKPCGCFFETIATGAQPAECVACSADTECPNEGDKCNYGYCEAYRAAGESEG